MKKLIKKLFKLIGFIITIPVLYVLIALLLGAIGTNKLIEKDKAKHIIYLNTNGVHLDIVLPKNTINTKLLDGLVHKSSDKYFAFGWGEENFYLNTPTWDDLKLKTAIKALFHENSTLIHTTRYPYKQSDWVAIYINEEQLKKLNEYIVNSFQLKNTHKIHLKDKGYFYNDDFYKAVGSYSCFRTCNTWVNKGLQQSGIKSCYWTPFDFQLLNKHK